MIDAILWLRSGELTIARVLTQEIQPRSAIFTRSTSYLHTFAYLDGKTITHTPPYSSTRALAVGDQVELLIRSGEQPRIMLLDDLDGVALNSEGRFVPAHSRSQLMLTVALVVLLHITILGLPYLLNVLLSP